MNEVLAGYIDGLAVMALLLACAILVTGLDDLFIDFVFWMRWLRARLTGEVLHATPSVHELCQKPEKPLVIMVPAWQEHGVIGRMAELATATLDYHNYHIFVGTYPNDPQTQADADEVSARFSNVHKVVCARPGPTSKADCLNNILNAILQFERQCGIKFEGFILHDSEDVLAPMELRLFNWMVGPNDLVQVPVYPLVRSWRDFTSGHYLDEFSETHGKDLLVREALAGQVPSAGVGSCFSRRAVHALWRDGQGVAFDVQSLTEDYDISVRLKLHGLKEVFMRVPTPGASGARDPQEAGVIAVREYFPDTLTTAVRQKSRWIIGIVFQGFKRHRWTPDPVLNYFLWRDRKGVVVNLLGFLTTVLSIQFVVLWLAGVDGPARGEERVSGLAMAWLPTLLGINLGLILNRLTQRAIFVTQSYGPLQGLLSAPRMIWANLVNFLATWRAIGQVWRFGARRVAWDKTRHDFPTAGPAAASPKPAARPAPTQRVPDGADAAGRGGAVPAPAASASPGPVAPQGGMGFTLSGRPDVGKVRVLPAAAGGYSGLAGDARGGLQTGIRTAARAPWKI